MARAGPSNPGPKPRPAPAPAPGPKAERKRPLPVPVEPFDHPARAEQESVHDVYEAIAPHFAQTRYKPWPIVEFFLRSLPAGSIGLDSGAGNGKYLPTARAANLHMIALDRSAGLLSIAQEQEGRPPVVRADLCDRCWRDGVFDFAMSIAAIHHLSTVERRRSAVSTLLSVLRVDHLPEPTCGSSAAAEGSRTASGGRVGGGRFLIYVWAYEQGAGSKRRMGVLAPRPPDDSNGDPARPSDNGVEGKKEQDVLVPWVLQRDQPRAKRQQPAAADPEIEAGEQQEVEAEPQVLHRYYHLFVEGELRQLVLDAADEEGFQILSDNPKSDTDPPIAGKKYLRIVAEGWEADNWWIEGQVGIS